MSYQSLLPLIKKTGSTLTPEAFQERVNVVFHDYESVHYDEMHEDMWVSLQEQINLLVEDLFHSKVLINNNLRLLDIGCGTGLSSQILLQSRLGNHIQHVTLLDTSSKMLDQAAKKAEKWDIDYELKNSNISLLNDKYDVVIISSVLHHIPDLKAFLRQVDDLLNSGGILIHLQDPNGDYLTDSEYVMRKKEYEAQLDLTPKKRKLTDYIPKKILRTVKRLLNKKDYIDLVNDQLIAEKTIKTRMTAEEIWSVTDIHVETKDETAGKGISLFFLESQLINFELINMRSYAFFGFLKSNLTEKYSAVEDQLICENRKNGRNISCIWVKK